MRSVKTAAALVLLSGLVSVAVVAQAPSKPVTPTSCLASVTAEIQAVIAQLKALTSQLEQQIQQERTTFANAPNRSAYAATPDGTKAYDADYRQWQAAMATLRNKIDATRAAIETLEKKLEALKQKVPPATACDVATARRQLGAVRAYVDTLHSEVVGLRTALDAAQAPLSRTNTAATRQARFAAVQRTLGRVRATAARGLPVGSL